MQEIDTLENKLLDELLSSSLNESTEKATLFKLMEYYDIDIADCIDFYERSCFDTNLVRMPEGIKNLFTKLGSKLLGKGVGLSALVTVALKFFNKIMGTAIPVLPAALLAGMVKAIAKTKADPIYIEAKRLHKKAICRNMMRKALIKVGISSIVCNIVCDLFTEGPFSKKFDNELIASGVSLADGKTAADCKSESDIIKGLVA